MPNLIKKTFFLSWQSKFQQNQRKYYNERSNKLFKISKL